MDNIVLLPLLNFIGNEKFITTPQQKCYRGVSVVI